MTTLAHLETFVEVAGLGSFAAAARQLDLPRSTVTARIKALEEELGVALFQRTTRQVRLTVEGEAYREKVQPALRDLEEAGEQLKSAQAPQGMVRVSVPVALPLDVLAEAMASFNLEPYRCRRNPLAYGKLFKVNSILTLRWNSQVV